jgi:hypothetical protein
MADALILEFEGVTSSQYDEINSLLGIDMNAGTGDLPDGLLDHTACSGERFVVFELWESQAQQEAFMSSRLGPALGKAGVPEPSRAEWMSVAGHQHSH